MRCPDNKSAAQLLTEYRHSVDVLLPLLTAHADFSLRERINHCTRLGREVGELAQRLREEEERTTDRFLADALATISMIEEEITVTVESTLAPDPEDFKFRVPRLPDPPLRR